MDAALAFSLTTMPTRSLRCFVGIANSNRTEEFYFVLIAAVAQERQLGRFTVLATTAA